jgi:TrmH family RNA methyltransferase
VRSSRPRARPSTPPESRTSGDVATRAEIARLRRLLRDRSARDEQRVFLAEGPRVVAAAFEAGAPVESVYVEGEPPIATVARRAGVPVVELPTGAADRIGDTRTPQAVFAIVAKPRLGLAALADASLVLVGSRLSDPGNVGTLMRSAAAAGATGLGLGSGSVDAYNPKVVRASAGACFAIRTVEGLPAVEILATLGAQGLRRIGAAASGGRAPDELDLTRPTAIVLGNEAHGFDPALPIDDVVTIPMRAGESLNVAMAGTVLLFEAARQRREASR